MDSPLGPTGWTVCGMRNEDDQGQDSRQAEEMAASSQVRAAGVVRVKSYEQAHLQRHGAGSCCLMSAISLCISHLSSLCLCPTRLRDVLLLR
jgi:hypothetical protein